MPIILNLIKRFYNVGENNIPSQSYFEQLRLVVIQANELHVKKLISEISLPFVIFFDESLKVLIELFVF